MVNPHPRTDQLRPHQYKAIGEQPLSSRPIQVRLDADVDAVVRALPERSDWLRSVITEAAISQGLLNP